MSKIRVFIDVGAGDAVDFGEKLRDRIRSKKDELEVIYYSDLPEAEVDNENPVEWEEIVLKEVEKADVIVPILDSDYLSFITDEISENFSRIADSDNKYLFPVLYSPSDWSPYNWVVKSHVLPPDNVSITELTSEKTERVIDNLVKNIGDIISRRKKQLASKDQDVSVENKDTKGLVFISHDHDDADFAELLKMKLEQNGISSWMDTERLKIGQDWREEIDQGIGDSVAVIVIMTTEARKSEYVTYEWSFAWGKGKRIFPLMLKQTQLHPRLESLQYLDFTNRTTRPWEHLISEIQKLY